MLPDGWGVYKISEILERVSVPVFPEPEEYYNQIGIRSHGKGIFHKEPVTGKSLGSKRIFKIFPDCFIVNIVFAWEQAVAKTSDSETERVASHRFPMFQPKDNLCDVSYLTYFFKTPKGKYLLGLASPGGAGRNKTLGQNEFSRLKLTIPPTLEQQKIAKTLSTWDKAIETLDTLILAKQQRKKAFMQQLLTGKKRFDGFDEEWRTVKLSTICDLGAGQSAPQGERYFSDDGYQFLRVSDIGRSTTRYAPKARDKINDLAIKDFGLKVVKKGATLFTKSGASLLLNQRAQLMCDTFIVSHLGYAVAKKDIYHDFLYFLFCEINFKKYAAGTSLPALQLTALSNVKVMISPSLQEQQKIASVLAVADKEIENHQQQLDDLKQQKKGLMQQLLTGKKRVKLDATEIEV